MSISSKLGVSQFMLFVPFGGENQMAVRALEIACAYTVVKHDNVLKLLSKKPHYVTRKRGEIRQRCRPPRGALVDT